MFCELDVQEGMKILSDGERSPLDRRSFMKCALASGAALGMGERGPKPAAAMPSGAALSEAGRFALRRGSEVLPEAAESQDQVQAVSARMRGGRQGARLLRRARESRRNLLHAGALAGLRGARRSHREEAALPLSAGNNRLLDCHGRLQRQLQILPELGHLPVASRSRFPPIMLRRNALPNLPSNITAPRLPTPTASR